MTHSHLRSRNLGDSALQHQLRFIVAAMLLFAVGMGGFASAAQAQTTGHRPGTGERIAFESLGAGVGVLGGALIGTFAWLATSTDGSAGTGTYDFRFDLSYAVGLHTALGVSMVLGPVLARYLASGRNEPPVSWLYGLLGSVVLGAGGYAIGLAAGPDTGYFSPSGWALAPALGVFLGSILGLEVGAAIQGDSAVARPGDHPGSNTGALLLEPIAVAREGGVVFGVAGAF